MSDIVDEIERRIYSLECDDHFVAASTMREAAAEITRLRADLAAAQEREQRMREALILAERIKYMEGKDDGWIAATMGGCITAALSEASLEPYQRLFPRARAAFSAMRGEP